MPQIEERPGTDIAARGAEVDSALVQRIHREIRLDDRSALTTYGDQAQRGVAAFADTILQDTLNKESGAVGELLSDLIVKVNSLDPGSLGKVGLLERLWGGAKARVLRFKEKFSSLAAQVDRIALELERRSDALRRDIAMLDGLFDRNLAQMRELEAYIVAGTQIVEDVRARELPQLEAQARSAGDGVEGQLAAQKASDLAQNVERLERKVHDLKLSRMIALQTMPQIRLVQNGDTALVEKLQSSIATTIPTWKNGMTIALALHRQEAALRLQREVSDTTNALLKANAEKLRQGTAGIEREVQRGIVDIETLTHVNRQFVETVGEVLAIQRDGLAKRQAAEAELMRIEGELKRTFLGKPA
ncbi:toxic anion resistance protein [Methylobacterium fujisawaense]|uniref:toxic anion resistance protein n=1 Tax=Methylobacterium fujisawaense TaxID=107400 RepID=UPI002F2F1AE9